MPFYSVIVFYGDCRLKDVSYIPDDIYVGYAGNVRSILAEIINNNPVANYNDKWGVVNTLRDAVANGENIEIVNRHIQNIRNV